MEKVRPWCGQPSDRGRLRKEQNYVCVLRLILLRACSPVTSQQKHTRNASAACIVKRPVSWFIGINGV